MLGSARHGPTNNHRLEGMKIDRVRIEEGFPDVEIVIRCPNADEEIVSWAARLHTGDDKWVGMRDGVTHLIDRSDVLYFESVDKHSFIYTVDCVYQTPLRLYEVETTAGFFRSSKSQIVNIAKIVSLCPDLGGRLEVYLTSGERLIISRHYAKALKERLSLK